MKTSRLVASALCCFVASLSPACNCDGGDDVNQAEPHASAPAEVDFGGVALGVQGRTTVRLSNDGGDHLEIQDVTLEGEHAARFAFTLPGTTVHTMSSVSIPLTFRPIAEGAVEAELVIRSDATDHPELRVRLVGTGLPPALSVDPPLIDFGTIQPGTLPVQGLTITNSTNEAVDAVLRIVDDVDAAFGLPQSAGTELSIRVPPMGEVRELVVFQPDYGGVAQAVAFVEFCGQDCGLRVPLTGTLAAPRVWLDPLRVDFGVQGQDAQVTLPVTVENRGSTTLDVTAADIIAGADVFSVAGALPRTLMPGEQLSLDVTFEARLPGRTDGVLRVRSSDPRTPEATVDLTGATTGSDIVALPGAINFGVLTNDDVVDASVVLLNRGDEAANITSVSVEGEGFELLVPLTLPHTLGPAAALTLPVAFVPDGLGPSTGALVVQTDNVARPQLRVPLMATRTNQACAMEASALELNFGGLRIGQQAARVVTLRNVGTGACSLGLASVSPTFANDPGFRAEGGGEQVEPGQLVRVNVFFAAAARGDARAVIQVPVGGSTPVQITARGRGVAGSVSVNPAVVDFGGVPLGCASAQRTATLLSDGADPVQVDAPTILEGPFTVSFTGLPGTLQPGTARTLTLGFTPPALGEFSGTLQVIEHVPDALELLVILRGTGVDQSEPVTETFRVDGSQQKMDVLFVIDNSGSMGDNQQLLATNARRFIELADFRGSVDYHLGVITTDVEDGGELVGFPSYLTRNSGDPVSQFTQRAMVGTNGSGLEMGLETAKLAFSPTTLAFANAGFLRAAAGLAIVVVSDEDDSSPLDVQQYVDFFRGLKGGSNAPVVLSAITGGPTGCENASGDTATFAPRYAQAVGLTGGISASICAPDWGASLQRVGEAVFLTQRRYTLQTAARPGTVEVRVNGQLETSGWSYDAAAKAVEFTPDNLPPANATVTVTYVPEC